LVSLGQCLAPREQDATKTNHEHEIEKNAPFRLPQLNVSRLPSAWFQAFLCTDRNTKYYQGFDISIYF
jgi:hypothetical protein